MVISPVRHPIGLTPLSRLCVRTVLPLMPAAYREPLCLSEVLPPPEQYLALLQSALPDLHRSYWLMRRTTFLLPLLNYLIRAGLRRLLRAPAGRWPFPALSPQSVYRCLDPYPATPLRCSCSFLPKELRPHLRTERFGTPNMTAAMQLLQRKFLEAAVIPLCSGSHTC